MSSAAPLREPSELKSIRFFGPKIEPGGPAGLELLGGKGINLIELTRAGFPVPPGFVVTTEAYCAFVAHHGLQAGIMAIASRLSPDDAGALEAGSAEIRALFTSREIPEALAGPIRAAYRRLRDAGGERVAVRSSATAEDLAEASFAGQQDTYLNVRGEEAVLKAVRSCWASLWTARAIGYRVKQKIPAEQIALAAVIQQMVMAEAAGVMFTANPVTGARDEIVINAAWGLGEAIVGGHVTPDTLVVDKHTGKVREVTVAEKAVITAPTAEGTAESELSDERRHARVLDDGHADRLAVIGREVEAHYKSPQDIEWCLAGGEFFLVQARPITALPEEPVSPAELDKVRAEEIAEVRKRAEGRGKVQWAIYNLAETLKSPTPLTWDIISHFMGGSGGFVNMYRDLGYFPSQRVDREGILDLIAGKIYADLPKHAELFYDLWPYEYDTSTAADATTMLEGPPAKFNFERAGMAFLARLPIYGFKMIRQGRRVKKLAKRYLDRFLKEVLPPFLEYVQAARAKNLQAMSDEQVLAELAERERAFNAISRESEKTSFLAGYYHGRLTQTLQNILGEKEGQDLATRLIMGLDGDKTVEQNCDLHLVAQGRMTLRDFLAKHGHRAAGEFELAEPRWYEDPAYIQGQIHNYRQAHGGKPLEPMETHEKHKAERLEVERSLGGVLAENAAASLEADIRADLAGTQRYMPYRETSKYYYMMAYALIRDALEELARRWGLGRDLYFLRREELKDFGQKPSRREELKAEITMRQTRWRAMQLLDMPDFISSEDPEAVGRPVELAASADGVFAGKGVASGTETGVARIVHSPKNAGNLGPNYVLVCTSTDPGWTPLFVHARGVIVERGGMLSHGAIVARDFGIPCVVLANATKLIPDGAQIRIDGNRGRVELVGAAAAAKEA